MQLDEGLLPYATDAEKKYFAEVKRQKSVRAAARALDVHHGTVSKALQRLAKRAAKAGYSPAEDSAGLAPAGYEVKGKSILYGADGQPKMTWLKTRKEPAAEKLAALQESLEVLADPMRGKATPNTDPPIGSREDLLATYLMGDPHIGLMAWAGDSEANHDLKIGEADLFGAIDHLVDAAPPAKQALIINAGDFFHSDNQSNMTARSSNVLDVDSRWARVLQVGIRVMRRNIDRALEKHEHVTVINEIGNHDDHTSLMLSITLAAYYEQEPRVTIDVSPRPFHWYRFDSVLIGTTHGNNVKPSDLPGIMATDRAKDWGEVEHRLWFTGHIHHQKVFEFPGCVAESLRSLVAADAWHYSKGYRSRREMQCATIHGKYGEIARNTVGVQYLRDTRNEE